MPAFPNRFADWSATPARLLLLALALLLAASALVPIKAAHQAIATRGLVEAITDQAKAGEARPRDDDLKVYDAVIERLGKGENYYELVAEEHRKASYPVKPGFAVRLPTLAYISVWLGETGLTIAAFALLGAVVWAWWVRLGSEPGLKHYQAMGTALIFLGASLGLNRYYFALHELWAGMLLALAMALHRPGQKWGAALAVAALALAIREHVLPFVLLMGALALWRRHWREALAWGALVAAFFGWPCAASSFRRFAGAADRPAFARLAGAARPVGLPVQRGPVGQPSVPAALDRRTGGDADDFRLGRVEAPQRCLRHPAVPGLWPGLHDRRAARQFLLGHGDRPADVPGAGLRARRPGRAVAGGQTQILEIDRDPVAHPVAIAGGG